MENQPNNTEVWTDRFLKPTTMDAMLSLLATSNVDVSTWGSGSAKTAADLFGEIESGETVLTRENGVLLRNV